MKYTPTIWLWEKTKDRQREKGRKERNHISFTHPFSILCVTGGAWAQNKHNPVYFHEMHSLLKESNIKLINTQHLITKCDKGGKC